MVKANQSLQLSDADRNRLKALWEEAAVVVNPPPGQAAAQALAFGVNFRIHLGKAFAAAWATSKVVVKATAPSNLRMMAAPFRQSLRA